MECIQFDLRQVFDTLEESILIIDRTYKICEVNQAFCKRYGTRREEVIGRFCHSVTHRSPSPCWGKGVECPLQALSEGSRFHRVVHHHVLTDGASCWEEILATRFPPSFGELTYIIEELRDVSDLLRTHEVVDELTKEINLLKGILPICSRCHKIKDEQGKWERLETYIQDHSDANFSHGVCPECRKILYPDLPAKNERLGST